MDILSDTALRCYPGFCSLQSRPESHFKRADLDQWDLQDLRMVVRNRLSIAAEDLTWLIVYPPCETFSYGSRSSILEHRTLDGAAKTHIAQFHTALLHKLIHDIILPLHAANPQLRILLENPLHGCFRYCLPVQELVAQGWWLYRMDHCASAHPELDGEVAITEDGEVSAGLFPLKGTIWVGIYG